MIQSVYLLTNGMVMAFDEQGQQVEQYQGRIKEVLGGILTHPLAAELSYYWTFIDVWMQRVTHAQVACFWEQNFK